MSVRRDGEVEWLSVNRTQRRQFADKFHYAFSQERLASGDAHFTDPHAGEDSRHSEVVGERKVAVERALISGAAVNALIVAAVGDGNAQVGDGASEFVS